MLYLKVYQSNIPKRKKEVVTFEIDEGFLMRQLKEQGYVLIKKSEENNPEPPKESVYDICTKNTIKEDISISKILGI